MRVLADNIIIQPIQKHETQTGFESEYEVCHYVGIVLHVGEESKKAKSGDEVIFITMLPIIEEYNWYVIPEKDIKVILRSASE